ncbi:YndM family protein [Metabacillus arenae]|uniref:YndM family protein n=1 Tax=Metabacillus arenae TaxID=2771434 RepID=A0A926NBY5_9BACI|nr:YndM family protein [Metabacillus arenae]MBD1378714.1 YndM family protein [Metabacillus arenae]
MKTAGILLMKFVACIIAFTIGLDLFFDATVVDIVTFSLFITIVSYIVGDRLILSRLGRRAAIVADFLLVYISVWIFGSVLLESYIQIGWGSILSAIVITAAEVFVHSYLLRHFFTNQSERQKSAFNPRLAYGTEFAEEQDVFDKKNPEKEK